MSTRIYILLFTLSFLQPLHIFAYEKYNPKKTEPHAVDNIPYDEVLIGIGMLQNDIRTSTTTGARSPADATSTESGRANSKPLKKK